MCPPRLAMSHQPRSPVLLSLLIGIHVLAPHGWPLPPTYDDSMCPESFECGGVNISYPFYLSSATGVIADETYYCGYPDLKIFCQGEGDSKTPIILLGGNNYTIRSISYNNSTIVLADTDVLRGNNCPKVGHNVTFGTAAEWLNYTDSDENITFFLGCHNMPPKYPDDMHIYQITCPGFDAPPGHSFVLLPDPEDQDIPPLVHELAVYCSQVVAVPVLRDNLSMAIKETAFAKGGYGVVLKQGFELAWNPSMNDRCRPCVESYRRCSYNQSRELLGCLCSDGKVREQVCKSSNASTASPPRDEHLKKRRKIYIMASTLSVLLLCLAFSTLFLGHKKYRSKKISKETPRIEKYRSKKISKETPRIESILQKNGTLHPKRYTYAQVKRMTKSFAEKLGQGGFGVVYRGDLSDGRQIAVKMLKDSKADGEEFINEIASISKTSHVNIVTLLGFCLEGSKRALIYDYMPNGSLERYAFNENSKGENTLSWEKLFDIAVGIARGLEYLHRGCNTRIVHFDIKPHNILLDQNFCPKISDFGLAKLCLNKESVISMSGARGTIGYIAPEVFSKQFGTISSKSDVYSYGMMVLEMVGARDKNINANSESSSQYFPQWIYDHLDEYCVGASEINGEATEIVRKMIVIGLWCIQLNPTNRPTMTRVVEMLEGSTSDLELPPKVLLNG